MPSSNLTPFFFFYSFKLTSIILTLTLELVTLVNHRVLLLCDSSSWGALLNHVTKINVVASMLCYSSLIKNKNRTVYNKQHI